MSGAAVRTIAVDLADRCSVERLLEDLRQPDAPPLRGVFHAAGVLDDGVLIDQTAERFDGVFRAKAMGAWHLHCLIHEPLDLFVLISSVSSVFGTPGQANYAAANAMLDALAHLRRAAGRPAASINFGPWANGGMAVRSAALLRAETLGITPFAADAGIAALEEALTSGVTQTVAIEAKWSRLARGLPGLVGTPYLEHLTLPGLAVNGSPPSPESRRKLENAPEPARLTVAVAELRALVADALRLEPSQFESERSLAEAGVDSLISLEIKNRISQTFGVNLDTRTILHAPSLSTVAADLIRAIGLTSTTEVVATRRHSPVAGLTSFETFPVFSRTTSSRSPSIFRGGDSNSINPHIDRSSPSSLDSPRRSILFSIGRSHCLVTAWAH
jgi:acyl carrier protein